MLSEKLCHRREHRTSFTLKQKVTYGLEKIWEDKFPTVARVTSEVRKRIAGRDYREEVQAGDRGNKRLCNEWDFISMLFDFLITF